MADKKDNKQQSKVRKVLDEFRAGKLMSSDGEKVTEFPQALAIALSEAGAQEKARA